MTPSPTRARTEAEGPDRIIALDVIRPAQGSRVRRSGDRSARALSQWGRRCHRRAIRRPARGRPAPMPPIRMRSCERKLEQAFKGQVARVAFDELVAESWFTSTSTSIPAVTSSTPSPARPISTSTVRHHRRKACRCDVRLHRATDEAASTITLVENVKGPVPLVVMPHGGPFDIADKWTFDNVAQLAEAGYGVLQSVPAVPETSGRAHLHAGAEWGGKDAG